MTTLPDELDLRRFEDVIRGYEAKPESPGQVLLYGSSFFANWGYGDAKRQWLCATGGLLSAVNHGFGGATADELLYYYGRMVLPYAPSAVVLRAGINDVFRGYSPEDAWLLTERLVRWIRADFPQIPVVILQIFDFASAGERHGKMLRYNALTAEYAAAHELVTSLDISPFFHEDPSQCGTLEGFRDVFQEDGLHLRPPFYEDMAAYLAPAVAKILGVRLPAERN